MLRNIFNQDQKIGAVQTAFGILIGTGIWLTGIAGESTIKIGNTSAVRDTTDVVTPTEPSPDKQAKITSTLNALPLLFVENRGQFPDPVVYTMQGQSKSFFFTPDGVTISLTKEIEAEKATVKDGLMKTSLSSAPQRWAVKLDFVGANADIKPQGEDLQPAVISYFKGPQLTWKTGLKTYTGLRYPDLWPGIDLVYTGSVNQLKYQFEVRPGVDPKLIKLAYRGVTGLRLTEAGKLTVTTPVGDINDDHPVAYQMKDGQKVEVTADYVLGNHKADNHPYGFSLGDYDPTLPLVIDPSMLVYAGYIGGTREDVGLDIAVDSEGYAYVTGYTGSTEESFPATIGVFDDTYNKWAKDAFVAKVSADGSDLIYAGYIGGTAEDISYAIDIDTQGSAYVAGFTKSKNFPATLGSEFSHFHGSKYADAFVAKVSSDGTALEYSGFIGDTHHDVAYGIAVDTVGRAYITGQTWSKNFPVKVGPDLIPNEKTSAFVARVSADGSELEYSGFIGGDGLDRGYGIAVDSQYRAYVTGYTVSTETSFPVTVGPDDTYNGGNDAFVARVSADGSWLEYAGYIGGIKNDIAHAIAVDDYGNAYVTGYTESTETSFPVTLGPDLTHNGVRVDAFVAKISMDGARLDYAGYIGGAGEEKGYGIDVDARGNAYVTGYTSSNQTTFPVTVGPDLTGNYSADAFVARIAADGTRFDYAGYIGGRYWDIGNGIAVDTKGDAYIAGYTSSNQTTFPVTMGPDLTHNGGTYDAFVAKIANPFYEDQVDSPTVDYR